MLRVHQITSAAGAKSYYAQTDYYGQELVGDWGGKAAARLGLEGPVTLEAFNSLCDNRHPATGEQLSARHKATRTIGYDFNFNAPKGVSLLYALSGDERVLTAFRDAVKDTMQELEAEAKTRVRKGRRYEDRTTGELAWAEFVHFSARPVEGECDPSLHAHIVIQNVTYDNVENQWKASQFRGLKADAPYWQAAFHARLAGNLETLGYETERRGKSWDVASVARPTALKFSRRTEQIERIAAEKGIESAEAKSKLGATTRASKNKDATWEQLVEGWRDRMSVGEFAKISHARDKAKGPRPKLASAERESMLHSAEHLFARNSVVNYRDLLAEGLRHGVGRVSVAGIARAAETIGLIHRMDGDRRKSTWKPVLTEERKVIKLARDGRGTISRLGRKGGGGLERSGLSNDQRNALDKMLASTDFITLFEAPAGTGKTRTATALRSAIAETGKPLVAVAPSARAGRGVLRSEGFDGADTLTMLLTDKKLQAQAKGGVIFIDEAGMVGTPTMLRLAQLAKEIDARLILAGDRRQHHAVERGDALRLLADEAKLPVAALSENWRQTVPAYKKAVEHFKQGDAAKGLAQLDKLGWVEEKEGNALYDRAAEIYCQWRADGKEVLVVSPTHADAGLTTAAIRERLKSEGELGEEREFTRLVPAHLTDAEKADRHSYAVGDVLQFHKAAQGIKPGQRIEVMNDTTALQIAHPERFSVYRPASIRLAPGDLVQITANGSTKDKHRLNNGDVFGVRGFTREGDIQLSNGWIVSKDFEHWNHGYLSTSYGSQGRTVNRVLIVQSSLSTPATNQTQAYVSASRGREMAVVLTDSKESLRDAMGRDDRRQTASEFARCKRLSWRQRMQRHVLRMRRMAEQTKSRLLYREQHKRREVSR
jgi:conjugative relaxase-like TrwC/TraI family protein